MIDLDLSKAEPEGYSSCESMEDMSLSPAELRHDTSSTQTLSNTSGVTPIEDFDSILPPSLVLYTIASDKPPSKQFLSELQALLSHYQGIMVKYADATDPEIRRQLRERFCESEEDDASGSARTSQSILTFPALVLDDCIWIPADEPEWHEVVHEYLQEHCLVQTEEDLSDDESVDCFEQEGEEVEEIDDASGDFLDEEDAEELISYLAMDGADPEDDSSISSCNVTAAMGVNPDTVVTNYSGDSSVTQWTANRGQSLRTILTDSPSSNDQENDPLPPETKVPVTKGSNTKPKASASTLKVAKELTVKTPTNPVPKTSVVLSAPTSPSVRIVGTAPLRHHRLITLPGGAKLTVAVLTRQLMHTIPHRMQRIPNKSNSSPPVLQNSFRGSEGMIAWKRLFCTTDTAQFEDMNDDTWMAFGLKLLSHGIVFDYTPNEKDFRQKYLGVQPLRNIYSLNTLLNWCSNAPVDADQSCASDSESMSVLLRLSRAMDAIFDRSQQSEAARHLFRELEEAVCELQTLPVPTDPKLKQAFTLNLYNLMVRHAMILVRSNQRKGWVWPTSLEEMGRFFLKIGYTVDGDFISVSQVRSLLLSGSDTPMEIDSTERLSNTHTSAPMTSCMTWRGSRSRDAKSFCIGGGGRWKKESQRDDEFYPRALITTDVRLLMALTWGTNISPIAHTIFPDHLQNEMQLMAEQYCQKHITITEGPTAGTTKVVLPPLLSWYRLDFGKYAENVLQAVDPYLSKPQQIQIQHAQQFGKLKIAFGKANPTDWQCTFPQVTSLVKLTPLTPRSIHDLPVSPTNKKEASTTESTIARKGKLSVAFEPLKAIEPINFDKPDAVRSVISAQKTKTTTPTQEPVLLRDMGPSKSITDLSLYTSDMQPTAIGAKQKEFSDYKSVSSPPPAAYTVKTSTPPSSTKTKDTKKHEGPSRKYPTKLHLQPSPIKNVFTEIEVDRLYNAGAPRDIVPALSPPPEYTHWSTSPEEASPVNEQEIETGGFPLKLTRLYPTMDNDFCYSQSTESGGIGAGGDDENVCLLRHRWKDFIQPTLGPRQASLGDSLLLPPGGGQPNPATTNAVHHPPLEYNIEPPPGFTNLCHNVTEASIELGDLERGPSWYFCSDVSAITFGSDFEALLRMNSLPQLVPSPGGGAAVVSSYPSDQIQRFQHLSPGGGAAVVPSYSSDQIQRFQHLALQGYQ